MKIVCLLNRDDLFLQKIEARITIKKINIHTDVGSHDLTEPKNLNLVIVSAANYNISISILKLKPERGKRASINFEIKCVTIAYNIVQCKISFFCFVSLNRKLSDFSVCWHINLQNIYYVVYLHSNTFITGAVRVFIQTHTHCAASSWSDKTTASI